jgi:uncharacterized protein
LSSRLVELQERTRTALKSGDKEQVAALRMIVCELQKAAKDSGRPLDDNAETQVLKRELKRRLESIEAFRAGGREDLVKHEEYAAGILEELLPQPLDELALVTLVERAIEQTGTSSPRDMGKVMAKVMADGGSQVDGKAASRIVKERLSA